MPKYAVMVVCMFMVFFSNGYGDTIVLKNGSADVELKITSVRKEYINAVLSRYCIKSLSMEFFNNKDYPDVIVLNSTNTAMECKIKEMEKDYVRLQIPFSVISSLTVSSPSDDSAKMTVSDNIENRLRMGDAVAKEAITEPSEARISESMVAEYAREYENRDVPRTSSAKSVIGGKSYRLRGKKIKGENSSLEGELVKPDREPTGSGESITDEMLQELDIETSELNQQTAHESMESPEKDGIEGVEDAVENDKPVDQNPSLGRVEGRILHNGKPLPDCQVKLQMLEKGGLLAKGYHPVEGALEIETITDAEGVYRFMNVSPGMYKVYWKPPSDTVWVRRFKMEPDVTVNSGRLTNPKDIETMKRTLN